MLNKQLLCLSAPRTPAPPLRTVSARREVLDARFLFGRAKSKRVA